VYYKVVGVLTPVRKGDEYKHPLCSLAMGRHLDSWESNPFAVYYEVGEWTEAKVGGLLVFTDFKRADIFSTRYISQHVAIYTVECRMRMDVPPRCLDYLLDLRHAGVLWTEGLEGLGKVTGVARDVALGDSPKGTKAFRQVKLLEQVK
jgi:hypothetical protein